MKRQILLGTIALVAGSLMAADSGPKDDVAAAAGKLADSGNYSWKSIMDFGPNSQFTPGPTLGKVDSEGYAWLSVTFNDNTVEGLKKGEKVAVKGDDGWQSVSEGDGGGGGGGGFDPVTFMGRRMRTMKPPASEVQDLLPKVASLKKDGDVYSGDLTEEGAKDLLTMGFRRRGRGAAPTDAKGSVKFWIKDGALTKIQTHVTGKREFNGEMHDVDRTVTTDIKDVGVTKVSPSDEAKKKLS
ncbi:MAG TPA: hypothetical protein VH595_15500 [Verrucomicrobiae bacterium]|jgi:hypothetical protein|nr:hypothetical protein [Verrucomicrobiae bacterium]